MLPRVVWLALSLLAAPFAAQARPQVIAALLQDPTARYDHGVFGDKLEWGALTILHRDCATCAPVSLTITLPESSVFEDNAARIVDLDGDGLREVLVVEADVSKGAALAVYDAAGKVTATDNIGEKYRWLAPVGVGDFDDDGHPEIAYVDRPHLQRDLVFLRYAEGKLTEIARLPGFTNHRIGDRLIWGGSRNCGQGDEVIVANADWTRIMAVRLDSAPPRDLGPLARPRDLNTALRCTP